MNGQSFPLARREIKPAVGPHTAGKRAIPSPEEGEMFVCVLHMRVPVAIALIFWLY